MKFVNTLSLDARNSAAYNTSDYVDAIVLGANVAETFTIPAGARIAAFSSTANFYAQLSEYVLATAGYQVADFFGDILGFYSSGLANDATVYTASIVVDGGAAQPIAITGSAAQDFDQVVTELNADTTGAVWSIFDGSIRCTSSSTGATSTIAITDTDLFLTLTDFNVIEAAVDGDDPTNVAAIPAADITDGTSSTLNPATRVVTPGGVYSVIAPTIAIITIEYFAQ